MFVPLPSTSFPSVPSSKLVTRFEVPIHTFRRPKALSPRIIRLTYVASEAFPKLLWLPCTLTLQCTCCIPIFHTWSHSHPFCVMKIWNECIEGRSCHLFTIVFDLQTYSAAFEIWYCGESYFDIYWWCRWAETTSLNCGHQQAYFYPPRDIRTWRTMVEWYW
jgi:hypothetical protein